MLESAVDTHDGDPHHKYQHKHIQQDPQLNSQTAFDHHAVTEKGKVIISDGRRLIMLEGDKETVITKASLAMNIVLEESPQ